jgi:penicillin-binding protein 2
VNSYSKRKYIIILIFLLVAISFVIRLFRLQIVDVTYKRSATTNVLREVIDYPARGLVYDRNGELLVYNKAAYDLLVTPREVKAFDTIQLCKVLDISVEFFKQELQKAVKHSRFRPSVVVKQLSPEQYALLNEVMYKYPGFYFQSRTLRSYSSEMAAHVFGYVGEVNQANLDNDTYYRMGDYIGVTGIEYAYEKHLRGEKGARFYLVDVHNRIKGSYEKGRMDKTPIRGKDLLTSIDAGLQRYAEELMQNKAGSVVAIEPSTGEVLVLVSAPGYSPDKMVGRNRIQHFPLLVADTLKPLYNRALQAQYPPGSIFKIVQALIGLHENVITPTTRFTCAHGYHVGSFSQGCHHNGEFTLTPSIAQSCNAYYAHTFRRILEAPQYNNVKLAYEKWREHLVSFGFSKKISYEFSQEVSGFIPESDYYQRRVFPVSRWRALPLISLAIGQGEIQMTPIQMANMATILANRGYYYLPHVVKSIDGADVDPVFRQRNYTTIDTSYFELILDGMENVLNPNYGGTGSGSAIPGITYCGKTGTVQNPHGADHSTFIAFAPRDNPQIAIAVYVENGIWGSRYAGPIASLLIEKYITDDIQQSRKHVEKRMLEANLLYPDQPGYVKP